MVGTEGELINSQMKDCLFRVITPVNLYRVRFIGREVSKSTCKQNGTILIDAIGLHAHSHI